MLGSASLRPAKFVRLHRLTGTVRFRIGGLPPEFQIPRLRFERWKSGRLEQNLLIDALADFPSYNGLPPADLKWPRMSLWASVLIGDEANFTHRSQRSLLGTPCGGARTVLGLD